MEKITELQMKILNVVEQRPSITVPELIKGFDITEQEFYNEIRDLKRSGILKHVGLVNQGTWIVNRNAQS